MQIFMELNMKIFFAKLYGAQRDPKTIKIGVWSLKTSLGQFWPKRLKRP